MHWQKVNLMMVAPMNKMIVYCRKMELND